jgi:hypothetical protein
MYLYVYPLIVARQRLGKNAPIVAAQRLGINVTTVTNTHATIEERLDASVSMWPVSYQGMYASSSWGGVRLSPLGTSAIIWPNVPAPDDIC